MVVESSDQLLDVGSDHIAELDEIPPVLGTKGEKCQSGLQLLRCDLQLIAQTSHRLRALRLSHTDFQAHNRHDPKVDVLGTSTFGS